MMIELLTKKREEEVIARTSYDEARPHKPYGCAHYI